MKSIDEEFCLPYDNNNFEFWMRLEHLGRYLFAADCIRRYKARIVLDLACANGYGCFEMAKAAQETYGADYNQKLIEQAQKTAKDEKNSKVYFRNLDLNKQSLDGLMNASPDLTTCFDTLEHLKEPKSFLNNLSSIMKKESMLLLSVPKGDFERTDKHGNLKNPYHLHKFSKDDIAELLKNAGFKIVKSMGQPYTNICMSLENNVCRDTRTKKKDVRKHFNQSKEAIRHFARMFGLPSQDLLEFSYTIFVVAQKI